MFSGLRNNNILYILEKTDNGLKVQTAQVVSVSNPQPKYQQFNATTPNFTVQPEMVVDVKVKVDNEELEFKQLGANLSIANSGNMIVSDSREAINAEIDGIVAMSRQHIEATPFHEKIIATSDEVKRIINPAFAKEKEQEEKIGMLEEKMSGIEGTLNQMMGLLSEAVNHSKSKTKKEE